MRVFSDFLRRLSTALARPASVVFKRARAAEANACDVGADVSGRGPLLLLVDPRFGGFFWGKLIAIAGNWVHAVVSAVIVYDLTASTLMVGAVSAAQFAPQLLSPVSGMWADRGHIAAQIRLGRVLCAIGSGSLAILFLTDAPGDHPLATTFTIMAASLFVGIGFAVGGPAQQSLVPLLVRDSELSSAMALNVAPTTVGRIVGPVAGTYAAAQIGTAAAFALAGMAQLAFIAIWAVTDMGAVLAQRRETSSDSSVRAGLRHVRRDRPLLLMLVGISAVGFGSEPSMTLTPALVAQLGGSAAAVGYLVASFGVGAGLGVVITVGLSRGSRPENVAFVGLSMMTLGLCASGLGPTVPFVCAAYAATGLGFAGAMSGITTLIQQRVPAVLRGRIMALWLLGFLGTRPIAAAVTGATSDALSVRHAFFLTATVMLVALVICRPAALTSPSDGPDET